MKIIVKNKMIHINHKIIQKINNNHHQFNKIMYFFNQNNHNKLIQYHNK